MNTNYMSYLMREINKEESARYHENYLHALQMDLSELTAILQTQTAKQLHTDTYRLLQIPTCGCTYQCQNGEIIGCSMCNLHKDSYRIYACMRALRERDELGYCNLIKELCAKSRGQQQKFSIHEFLFAHNALHEFEVPESLLKELLYADCANHMPRPMVYEFETRADTITETRLQMLKKWTGNRRVFIRIGGETANEVLRNSWLNKGITNVAIKNAVELCHAYGFLISVNILLGIPGLTEDLSLKCVCETIAWLDQIGADQMVCSILSRKKHTLQHYIYQALHAHSSLVRCGISQGQHTALPWLFTAVRLLNWMKKDYRPRAQFTFGQFEPRYFEGNVVQSYNSKHQCICNKRIWKAIQEIAFSGEWDEIYDLTNFCLQDPCYRQYEELLTKQSQINSVHQNLMLLEVPLSQTLYKENWIFYHNLFKTELQSLGV